MNQEERTKDSSKGKEAMADGGGSKDSREGLLCRFWQRVLGVAKTQGRGFLEGGLKARP